MLEVTIELTETTWDDLEFGLDVVKAKLRDQYTSGFDSNETGSYSFTVTGEEDKWVNRGEGICENAECDDPQIGYHCAICKRLTCVSCDTYYYVTDEATGKWMSNRNTIMEVAGLDGNVAHQKCVDWSRHSAQITN